MAVGGFVYSLVYIFTMFPTKKGTCDDASPFPKSNSGGRIRTCDLRVMSPTSYQAALPRILARHSSRPVVVGQGDSSPAFSGRSYGVLMCAPPRAWAPFFGLP